MKTLIMKIAMMATIVLTIGTANAQDVTMEQVKSMTPEQIAEKQTETMKTKLQLTDEQVDDVYDINLKYASQVKSISASADSRSTKAMGLKEVGQNKKADMSTVLTDEQMEQFKQMQEENKEQMKQQYRNRQR